MIAPPLAAAPPFTLEAFMSVDSYWPDSNVAALRAVAMRLGIDPRDIVAVMANESGCVPNPGHHGPARGLIQFEPETLKGLGWHGSPDDFTAQLGVAEQLPYVERYYAPYARAGLLQGGVGTLYAATFLPALLAHAGDPAFVLCGARGPFAWAYQANRMFDRAGKGAITVQDLVDAAERAVAASPRARAIIAELDALDADASAPAVANDNGQCAESEDEAG